MKIYRIVFADNQGSFAVDALAQSVYGTCRNAVSRYNGERDLAFVEVPEENCEFLEQLMEQDENVIEFRESANS